MISFAVEGVGRDAANLLTQPKPNESNVDENVPDASHMR
jgi:hypothetical protein